MTLDETITLLKFNNKHISDLKNDDLQQTAEWLEELKSYRASVFSGDMTQKMLKEEYCKAVDDFAEACKQDIMCQTFGLKPRNIDEIAEQLKAGDGE